MNKNNIFDKLNLQNLMPSEKAEILKLAQQILIKRIVIRISKNLSKEEVLEISRKKSVEELKKYLKSRIKDFNDILINEGERLRNELISKFT